MTPRDLIRRTIPRPVRNFLRRPGASATWLWREAAFRFGRTARMRIRDDWEIRCHPLSVGPFDLFRRDADSRDELDAFIAHCRPGMVLFDAGAHHGFFALAALRYGAPGAKVVSIDASGSAVRIMKENLSLNGVNGDVRVIESAVGSEPGILRMITAGTGGVGYFHGVDGNRPDAMPVPQITLTGLAETCGLVPTHIKIDVEGFEGEAIRGAEDLLRARRPVVYLELHSAILRGRGKDPKAVLGQLAALGYSKLLHHETPISPDEATESDIIRLVCLPG